MALRNWRPGHLLAAWSAWWLTVGAVKLSPAVLAIFKATSGPDNKSSVAAGFGDGGLNLTVVDAGTTVWTGTASLGAITLWVAVPPLLLWVAWLFARPRRDSVRSPASRIRLESSKPAANVPSRGRERIERE